MPLSSPLDPTVAVPLTEHSIALYQVDGARSGDRGGDSANRIYIPSLMTR